MDRTKKNIVELTRCSVGTYKKIEKRPVILFADNVRSMYNVGAMLRTADGFLIEEMIMGGITGTPPHPEITKTALGAEQSVAWHHVMDSVEEVKRLRNEGWMVCVLEQTHNSLPLQAFHLEEGRRAVLVVGNEVEGVDQRIVDMADVVLEIPQGGVKHSLNVSVSAAIALWQLIFK